MGADFIYHILPLCEITPQRKIELIWVIEKLENTTEARKLFWDDLILEDMDLDEIKETLIDYIEEYKEFACRRDVGWLSLNGAKYLLTGGMSWGDDPTDSFKDFEYLDWAWDCLEEWSKEDEK